MFIYNSTTGAFEGHGVETNGYSGTGAGRNNPEMENVQGVGPIPRGEYRIGSSYNDIHGLGPVVMHLDPLPGTNTFGRSLFRIHGDNSEHDASHGCVILPHDARVAVSKFAGETLKVV